MTSIQLYLLFLTLQGKETNFRGHKPTQNKVQKNKMKEDSEKVPILAKKCVTGSYKHKFRKTRGWLGQENPKKEGEPITPTRKLSHKQNILYTSRSTNTSCTMQIHFFVTPLG